ncbi:MAG TPA: acetyl-CoA carboxylase biotin carboxyl carrier protein [bacterium]|nr:acetyl-CoA carboxylase biotin carboxyl carrier protein [bacterium]
MNIGKLKKILDLMDERGIAEIEMRSWFRTVRISRAAAGANVSFISAGPVNPALAGPAGKAAAPPLPGGEAAAVAAEAEAADEDLIVIKSPMVGTFYRAPAPDADPFVAEGDKVSRGEVLCIIEAMKIMNEIESEHAGTVARIYVENAAPVEYGQPLFSLEAA